MPEPWDVIDSPLDPSRFAKSDDDGGAVLPKEKHPVATLWVVTGDDPEDMEGLLYGGFRSLKRRKGKIVVIYEGLMEQNGEETLDYYRLEIEGSNLEKLAYYLGKQVLNILKVGNEKGYDVKSISLNPVKVIGG